MFASAKLLYFMIGLIFCLGPAQGDGTPTLAHIKDLDKNNFEELISNSQYALVEFYANWCGYCQEFAPIYEEAARRLAELNTSILVGKVDAPENEDLADQYDIDGLPTIRWFVNGKDEHEYSGSHNIDSFMGWIRKVMTTPAEEINTEEDLDRSRENTLSIIGVFDEYSGDLYQGFMGLAMFSEDVVFYRTTNRDLVQVENTPGLVFSKNISGHPFEVIRKALVVREGELAENEIYDFIDAHKYPDYFMFGTGAVENMTETIEKVDREFHIHVVVNEDTLKDANFLESVREAGKDVESKCALFLSVLDAKSPLMDSFKVQNVSNIQIFAAQTQSIRKYSLDPVDPKNFDPEIVIAFSKSITSGERKYRQYASGAAPDNNSENGITIVVRDTMDSIAKDPEKDVLVHVYQPEDDESVYINSDLENLAKALANISSIVLSKFDASVNEHEDIDYAFEELPKIVLFPAKQNAKPVVMDTTEGADVQSMGTFIAENVAIKFELPSLEQYAREDEYDEYTGPEEDEDDSAADDEASGSHDEL